LYNHLMDSTKTVGNEKGGILLAFSRQHLPEKTEAIVTAQKEEYGKKNARLDERITELKKAEKKAKKEQTLKVKKATASKSDKVSKMQSKVEAIAV
jgi:ParB family chromosome partitioning protein